MRNFRLLRPILVAKTNENRVLEAPWGVGRPGAVLKAFWAVLGRLGGVMGRIEGVFGPLGGVLARLGSVVEAL